ncbi:PREDICTED: LOB domain-containing protein 2-like [Lupinus angustifolius]|uniref:LOB domain-containing protein 2-like n=1 Tax=Lupinus angustifolius TaxID=3871 RepID=UPI00092F40D0|nr:PREDICTED: LOB domain-containing protein 2-like [Lupinus angustifolius]
MPPPPSASHSHASPYSTPSMVRYTNKEEGEGNNASRHACAACRHLKKKCNKDCVLAPYFPTKKIKQYFVVHKVFGYNIMTKMLSNLVEQERNEAVESFQWEAMMWQQDPVHGPLGAYKKVCDMNRVLLTQQAIQSFEAVDMITLH